VQHFRASDGASLAFSDEGSVEPPVLFVHGWQAERGVWREVTTALNENARAIAVDLRGSGESRAATGPFALERFATDLWELTRTLALPPAVVVGHSMGATVALRFAVDYPQAVRGLVLIAPVPASGGGYSPKGEAYLRATAGDPDAAKAWLARTFATPPDEARLRSLIDAAATTRREVALESFESWAHADFADATRAINVPVLVIAPEKDAPETTLAKVTALLPHARQQLLAGGAHYAIVEQPAEIAGLIRGFTTSLSGSTATA
jgi:pimeloyl-ACP methyl ester carboxylesterase